MFMDWKSNIVKVTILPKAIHGFGVILTEIPMVLFAEVEELILKFICNFKGSQITKTILKNQKVGRLTFLDFKTYYKSTVIKTL